MNKWFCLICLVALLGLTACSTGTGGSVTQKVMYDFGLGEKPAGYVSGSDKVYTELEKVAATEIKRMNTAARNGEIKFEQDGLKGSYHKEAKVYESSLPLDVKASTAGQDRGYVGLIEYRFRMFRGASKPTRAEAAAETASDPTDTEGRETYRYNFTTGGTWDGGKGERSNR